eukprot:2739632-Pyramimonas_sp.AAC.1
MTDDRVVARSGERSACELSGGAVHSDETNCFDGVNVCRYRSKAGSRRAPGGTHEQTRNQPVTVLHRTVAKPEMNDYAAK